MNSIQVAEQIKIAHPHTRIIVYTAHRKETFFDPAMAVGADAVYTKEELTDLVLEDLVHQWFSSQKTTAERRNMQ